MSLESLLAPFQWLDEQLLRQYTKFALWQEEKGHDNKDLAAYSVYVSGICLGSLSAQGYFSGNFIGGMAASAYSSASLVAGYLLKKSPRKIEAESSTDVLNTQHEFRRDLYRAGRISLISLISIDTALNYQKYAENMPQTLLGYGSLAGWISALYFLDVDKKLLSKQPLYKRVWNWMKDKVSSNPLPEPGNL